MKYLRKMILLLTVAAMLLTAAGCNQPPVEETQPQTEPAIAETAPVDTTQEDLTALYQAAVDAVNTGSVSMDVTYTRSVSVAEQTYGESGEMSIDYCNLGTEDFTAKVKQTVTYGDGVYDIDLQEVYGGGKIYQVLGGEKFAAEMTQEDFLARYVPVKMLDAALYTLSADETETVITFADATGSENWLIPEDSELISASGSVEIKDGALVKTVYTAQYLYGAVTTDITYTAQITETGRTAAVPTDGEDYLVLDYIDAAYALEHAYGYLSQAQHITANTGNVIVSSAAGIALQNNSTINIYAVDEEYAARWEESIGLTDYSLNETEWLEQEEKFIDGKYTVSVDGGRETTDSSIERVDIENALAEELLAYILPAELIEQVEVTDLGSVLLLEYNDSEAMSEYFCEAIGETLFGSRVLLNNLSTDYYTETMEYYLALDKYSMLPTAIGVDYEGVHIIDGYECPLIQQMTQSFDMASLTAYDGIFEEPAPETEPETPATPLFYHVTGSDGQEMWLLGTIHVGDERTGFLPQEIYDAFYASDAFAIECNNDAFEEQLEEDEQLQDVVYEAYYYQDDSMVSDHLDTPELYDNARKLLKATGNYNYNMEFIKPYVWGSTIDDFYMRQGYSLCYEKGVENRLLKLAEEEDIPVWEVESCLMQLQMTMGFSEDLQEFLLWSSCASGAQESWESTMELYDLWCSGDEAALIEMIASEPWSFAEEDFDMENLTEEEEEEVQAILADLDNINAQLATIYEEYYMAMEYNRNAGMLEVAVEYLESGDTIFYAVGLAHLLGENGLVFTLRDAGYTVELVPYQ